MTSIHSLLEECYDQLLCSDYCCVGPGWVKKPGSETRGELRATWIRRPVEARGARTKSAAPKPSFRTGAVSKLQSRG